MSFCVEFWPSGPIPYLFETSFDSLSTSVSSARVYSSFEIVLSALIIEVFRIQERRSGTSSDSPKTWVLFLLFIFLMRIFLNL